MFNDILNAIRGGKTAINNIGGDEFARLMKEESNAIILDVRTPGEYAMGHIAGAVNIDISGRDFSGKIDALDRDATVLLYCRSGSRSYHAGGMMGRMGFGKVYNLADGLFDWNGELKR